MMAIEKRHHFCISIADKIIQIECEEARVLIQCKDYLSDSNHPDYLVTVSRKEIFEENANEDVGAITGLNNNRVALSHATDELESIVLQKKIAELLIKDRVLLMHGAVISTNNIGYMFTAPSGVGKSTRAKLWIDEISESIIVNGDKPLIKLNSNEVFACGTPWCGNEGWNTNTMVPLRAIFLLERSDEDETSTIEEISIGKAFPFLLQQTYRPSDPDLMRKTIQLLKAFEGKVKIYKFRSTPTPEAVRLAYEAARPR